MTVWPEGSRPATAERIATVLPVPASPVIIAMVFSDTAQAIRAAAALRAPEMNSQAPLTAPAGSVPSSQPSCPAARAAASHRPTWARSCGRPAGRGERQLAAELVGVGGL